MSLQFTIWILLFGSVQGVLLAFLFLHRKVYQKGYLFLLVYVLLLTIQILFKVGSKHWLMEQAYDFYNLTYKFSFLYGPLAWLFVREAIGANKRFRPVDILHFLPFIYAVFVLSNSNRLDEFEWLYLPMKSAVALVLQSVSLIIYHGFALQLLNRHGDSFSSIEEVRLSVKKKWIKQFVLCSLFVCLAITALGFLLHLWYPIHQWLRFGFVLLCVFVYWISYSAMKQPAVFEVSYLPYSEAVVHENYKMPNLTVYKPARKYAHSTLSDIEAKKIITALDSLMREEKLFKEPQLDAGTLCVKLGTNRYLLSRVLNERIKQSFYEYVNSWRISYAKQLLTDPSYSSQKIASIGYESGFNSLSTFNEVFKNSTGLTPSKFKKVQIAQVQSRII